jgi:hypothetical protein
MPHQPFADSIRSPIRGIVSAFAMIAAGAFELHAQGSSKSSVDSANPKTPSECMAFVVKPALNAYYKMMSDSSHAADTATFARFLPKLTKIWDSTIVGSAKQCATKYSMKKVAPAELGPLADLYFQANMTDSGVAVNRLALSLASTPKEKLDVLSRAFSAPMNGPDRAGTLRIKEGYLDQMDALGDIALKQRVEKRVLLGQMSGRNDSVARAHFHKAIRLALSVKDPALRKEVMPSAAGAYVQLVQGAQDNGDLTYAAAVADSGALAMAGADTSSGLVKQAIGYGLLGKKAATVEASNWFNQPTGFTKFEPGKSGKVTVIYSTSYW